MISWLRGVIPPMVTPFDAQGEIDQEAVKSEVEFYIGCGVLGLCAGGSTGEGAGFNRDDVYNLCSRVVKEVKGRLPVIGGIIPDTTREAIELSLAAKEAGVAALQVTPPHYIFQPGIPELVSYYSEIQQRIKLPIILYNVLPWAQVSVDGVARLLEADAIVAIKQSGLNMHQVADMVYRFGQRLPILTAVDDLLYPSFVLGCQGTICASATILPRKCVELYQAVQLGNHNRALSLHNQVLSVWRAVEGTEGFLGRVKYAIELQGRRAGVPRGPHRTASEDERVVVQRAFQEAGIPVVGISHPGRRVA
jgi:4-hydroxy-tetrahydrodipicolinate synthase